MVEVRPESAIEIGLIVKIDSEAEPAQSVESELIVRLRRFVKDASVQMMELDVNGIKMDVQYCPAGKLIDWYGDYSLWPAFMLI